jgi:hypothetical protein
VGCGTGADSIYLARRGVWMTAIDVAHFLSSPEDLYREGFAEDFELISMKAIHVLRPSSASRLPQSVVHALRRIDEMMSSKRLFLNWGRFYVLEMKNKRVGI